MEFRLQSNGAVMTEDELRRYCRENNGPTWGQTTPEVLAVIGADPVFEGPQATGLEWWQYSMRSGVILISGKWYTRYIPGPVFTDTPEATAAEQRDEYIAARTAERLANHITQIKAERDRRTLEGGYPVAGKWFHSDTVSRTQQLGLVMMGANLPAGIQWKTMDGTFVTMTPALAQLLFQSATVQDTTTFAAAQQAIAQATADPANFNPATIAWPTIYTPS
jgi:hypothetical protein